MFRTKEKSSYPILPPDDRGEAKYFHGREEILYNFAATLGRADNTNGGTIFLIQGPPGAGKTALLYQCLKQAEAYGWQTAEIEPEHLWSPKRLQKNLGLPPAERITGKEQEAGATSHVTATTKREITVESSPLTPRDILEDGEKPLLLILDEAQRLGSSHPPPANLRGPTTSLLHGIHNGKLGRPVVLLTAGLGMTAQVLESLDISRITGRGLVELKSLSKESERKILQDWLVKDRGADKDELSPWLEAITAETHCCPHHTMSYTDPAVSCLTANEGNLTAEGLRIVLREGRKLRTAYYEQRANGIKRKERRSFARILANNPSDKVLEEDHIPNPLSREYEDKTARGLFHLMLRKGILHHDDGAYAVPIPSFHDWVLVNYME